MTLIKDLINIPERVQKGDFVLKLTEGVTDPQETLREYVVTPELAKCFDAALGFIRSALQGHTSKATFLHGSFGAGKSHFMAVLHLVLQGNPAARGIPELATVIQKHNEWLAGKKFLLIPFHMLNSHDMESGILGNYVEFMRRTHPEAPVPPVYASAAIIEQARGERASYGDEPFFNRLNAGQAGAWGDLTEAWTAAKFEEAAGAPPDSEKHLLLVSTLLKTVATSHAEVITHRGGNFIRFDKGLSVISRHASDLGYHALILFLDELILWLATHAADLSFVNREAAKLTNLVEAQSADRPIPLVSFVARQRDLRELVGNHVPGAQQLSFGDSLDFQQGRFDTITLEDRNLPAIAEKRVLKVKNAAARQELDAAFEQTARMKDNVLNILLTQTGDKQMFRKVYPFSPALIQTLIAVSSVLQRERTALKVMMQLLVDQRETLQVGEIIPVGDLFDVVAHGDEAFSPEMAIHFDNAKRLYHQKLLPLLERTHGARREELEALPYGDPKRTAFRNDDRLVKTLLLSALVPEVEALRGLNAEKLAALNHGTIKTPIPGREAQEVLRRVRSWAGDAGEIRIGEEANPTISVQLSGVDVEAIIAQARREDNQGNRIRRVRQMLFDQLGVTGDGEFEQFHEFLWRNTPRRAEILFKNIRELPASSLQNSSDDWKLVIDFPFDEAGRTPRDDLSVLQNFLQSHPEGTKTLCWVPSFFSADAQKDLGMLVILEYVLTGERFGQFATHLSPQDRLAAKSTLESQRGVLKQRVQNHLDAAYGLDAIMAGSLDTTHDLELNEHYASLDPGFVPQAPVAVNLHAAADHLLSQALAHEYPGAPHFEAEIKPSVLKKVYELVLPATQAPDGRLAIDKLQRTLLRQVANPLQLGDMGPDATHFVLGQHWKSHFSRIDGNAGTPVTVGQLRQRIDEPKPMGLSKESQNLVILLYAAQTDKTLYRHGGPYESATLQTLPDECELRSTVLPDESDWEVAVARAGSVFGLTVSRLRNAANVGRLSSDVQQQAKGVRTACQKYLQQLRDRLPEFELNVQETDRGRTAAATLALVEQLVAVATGAVVDVLAKAKVETSEAAMGECLKGAGELEGSLDTYGWELIDAVRKFTDHRQAAVQLIVDSVRQALGSDEHALALAPALKAAHAKALQILAVTPPPGPKVLGPVKPDAGKHIVSEHSSSDITVEAVQKLLADLKHGLKPGQTARVSISWVIEEGGPK
ncbi:phage resistance protein [Planctellipticum variicoloris]|uniref:phage resistance protein n=1 Tax=Planctellipticum variicoloris TaxID=3064265 RepID=UPI00301408E4|nr:phage resistance protein [Planctomycetaceae bacterium SH412]